MDSIDFNSIHSTKLFDGLPDELMERIIGNRSVQTLNKGHLIFQQGDEATHFYVILSGWVKLFRQLPSGDEAILHMFTTGETFAEAAMFDSQKYPASAEIVADAKLLAINSEYFKIQLAEYPEIAMRMLATMAIRLKHLVNEIEQIKARTSIQRVAHFLLGFCSEDSISAVIELPYEKNLIATRLGIKPESLSRVLNQLRGYGVQCVKNKIVISDTNSLKRIVMGNN